MTEPVEGVDYATREGVPAPDLTDTLCWSCQAPATRLSARDEPRCDACPDDHSEATATPHPSDMSASENYSHPS